jgi:DNA-binding CsgD family transcriptional regulator/tetratricopeptide (TPR) repeat protein
LADDLAPLVVSQHAVLRLLGGDVGRALEVVESILADPRARPADRLWGELVLVPVLCLAGRLQEAIDAAAEIVPRLLSSDDIDPYAAGHVAAVVSLCHLFLGDLDAAEEVATSVYATSSEGNVRLVRGAAALRLGEVLLWRGRPARAAPYLREAVASLEGDELSLVSAVDHLRYVTVLAGDEDVLAPGTPSPLYAVATGWLRAAIAGACGQRTEARAGALEAAGLGLRMGQITYAAIAVYEAARHGAEEAAAELADRLPAVEGRLVPTLLDAVRALADDDGDAIERAATALGDLGCVMHAAELATRAQLAFDRVGLRARASGAGQRARAFLVACEGVSSPLVPLAPAADPLTRREREVAELAARGATDAEIAAQLFVSVRTVETHLHRAYAKLGVNKRSQLPGALGLPAL